MQNWQTGGSQIIENLRNEKGCPYKTDQSSRKEQNKKAAKELAIGNLQCLFTNPSQSYPSNIANLIFFW